jgi:hypothetical protein
LAVLFLVVLFLIKNGFSFQNKTFYGSPQDGLTYSTAVIGDLVNKDTDGDGIPDWEEPLWNLDPNKKETTPGSPDSTVIAKLKAEQNSGAGVMNGDSQGTEKLTETDKFSRELFTTVATLNQSGAVDQATIDKIGSSLAEHVKNTPVRKIFTLADIKIINDNGIGSVVKYNDTLNSIYKKNRVSGNVPDILKKFIADGNNVDVGALTELDPIIKETQNMLDGIVKINVPSDFAQIHLDVINGLERLAENLNDMKLYDSDVMVALSGTSQYQTNAALFESTIKNLADLINEKLNN